MVAMPGATELVIIATIVLINVVPAVGIYRIARRAEFGGGASAAWAFALLIPVVGWLVPLALGFVPWPRDGAAA